MAAPTGGLSDVRVVLPPRDSGEQKLLSLCTCGCSAGSLLADAGCCRRCAASLLGRCSQDVVLGGRWSREVQGGVVPGAPACSARRTPRSQHGPSSAAGSPQRGAPGIPAPRPVEVHYFQTNAGFFHVISHFFYFIISTGKKNKLARYN